MKRKHVILICAIFVLYSIFCCQKIFAIGNIYVVSEVEKVKKGEEFQISINVKNIPIVACTLYLYFDETKVEYISENENANVQKNQVLYTWVDESGGQSAKENEGIVIFKFKAKEMGTADFGVMGEFYDNNAKLQEIEFRGTRVEIEDENTNDFKKEEVEKVDTSEDNSLLSIMRLNKEGINPEFAPDIMEYYIIVDENVDNLKVTAVPQNPDASIKITGNNNLRNGANKIKIEITSEDKSNKSVYTINVTKTSDKHRSNANLENLAIENAILNPSFTPEMTQYNTEVSKNVTTLNILAVPEDINSNITIEGNENLIEGNNIVIVKVIAQDNITQKQYMIKIYRRNEQEEIKREEEQQHDAERLSAIIEEKELENNNIENNYESQEGKVNIIYPIIVTVIVIIIGTISAVIIYRGRRSKQK